MTNIHFIEQSLNQQLIKETTKEKITIKRNGADFETIDLIIRKAFPDDDYNTYRQTGREEQIQPYEYFYGFKPKSPDGEEKVYFMWAASKIDTRPGNRIVNAQDFFIINN